MQHSYIAIEGLIGAGKTTFARRLAADLGARLVLEEFEDNPFLPRFYAEPDRYAFSVELSFLAQRYHQLKRITEQDLFATTTIADYSLGKSLVFAGATLPPDELALFRDLYGIMYQDLPQPELIVYLHLDMDRVRERIRSRGRSYEQQIATDYLSTLHERYMDHFQKMPQGRVLVIDLGSTDLQHDRSAYDRFKALLSMDLPLGFHVFSI
jgi:deoxyguanosine kinase